MDDLAVLILDGGLGTSLEDKYGVRFDSSTPLWSSHLLLSPSGRETLLACQKDFACVPVDILSTPTYQISLEGFAQTRTVTHREGVDRSEAVKFLEDALCITEAAVAGRETRIALSLGPYGASMVPSQEYSGQYDSAHNSIMQLEDWHLDRLRLFMEIDGLASRVQYVAFETVPRRDEVIAIRQAVFRSGILQSNLDLRVWISCVFPDDGQTLPDGSLVSEVVHAMLDPDLSDFVPWGIGVNCTKLSGLGAVILGYEEAAKARIGEAAVQGVWPRLVVYPDGTNGEVYNTATQKWEVPTGQGSSLTPWETQLTEVISAACGRGHWKQIIAGGCCKTTHHSLQKLCDLLSAEGLCMTRSRTEV